MVEGYQGVASSPVAQALAQFYWACVRKEKGLWDSEPIFLLPP